MLGRLRQPNGTELLVTARTTTFDEDTIFRVDWTLQSPWWTMPESAHASSDRQAVFGVDHATGVRFFTEVRRHRTRPEPFNVPGFDGAILDWADRPRGPGRQNDFRFCAMLRVPRVGRPELYFDTRARCNLPRLGRDAARTIAQAREHGYDDGWDKRLDLSWVTGLISPRVFVGDVLDGRGAASPTDVSDVD